MFTTIISPIRFFVIYGSFLLIQNSLYLPFSKCLMGGCDFITLSSELLNNKSGLQQENILLEVGKPIHRELSGDETHSYLLNINQKKYLSIEVDQRSIDLKLNLFDITGQIVDTVDNPYGDTTPERLFWVSQNTGVYRLEVKASNKQAELGRYEIRIKELRDARIQDERTVEIVKKVRPLILEAEKLFADESKESFNKALTLYKQALQLLEDVDDQSQRANVLCNLGITLLQFSMLDEALEYFNKSLNLMREVKDQEGEAFVIGRIGVVWYRREQIRKSIYYSDLETKISNNLGRRYREAIALRNSGDAHHNLTDYQEALRCYLQSLPLFELYGSRRDLAIIFNNLGTIYREVGDFSRALEYFEKALQLQHEDVNKDVKATILLNMSSIFEQQNKLERVLVTLTQALDLARNAKDKQKEAEVLNYLGHIHTQLKHFKKAEEFYDRSLVIYTNDFKNRRGEASVLSGKGGLYLSKGDVQQSLYFYREALALSRFTEDKEKEFLSLANIGYVHEKTNNSKSALKYYLSAIKVREAIRESTSIEEFKIKLADKWSDVYLLALNQQIRLGQFTDAFNLTERARARTLLDQLGSSRINFRKGTDKQLIEKEEMLRLQISYFKVQLREYLSNTQIPDESTVSNLKKQIEDREREYEDLFIQLKLKNAEYKLHKNIAPSTLSKIQLLMDKDTTLVSYFVTDEQTLAFIISKKSFIVIKIPVSENELKSTITNFLSFDDLNNPHPQSLKNLYNWLFLKIKTKIKTKIVGIIPHSILHYVPFPALTNGRRYVSDEFTTFTISSASVMEFFKPKKDKTGEALVIGQGIASGLPFLQYANSEADAVSNLLHTKPLIGKAATRKAFLNQASNSKIIHLAAHSILNKSRPLFSSIMLTPEGDDMGALELNDINSLNLEKNDLVVLSACDSNLGIQSKGDDIVGLNRAFISAGTSTVIASLWAVNDLSTQKLMILLYKNLSLGMSKAAALQSAQTQIRSEYPHPYYWGAFILSGNPE